MSSNLNSLTLDGLSPYGGLVDELHDWFDITNAASLSKNMTTSINLADPGVWDDRALINSWNEALEEYKVPIFF